MNRSRPIPIDAAERLSIYARDVGERRAARDLGVTVTTLRRLQTQHAVERETADAAIDLLTELFDDEGGVA